MFGGEILLKYGDHRGFIFVDGHGLGEGVLEEVVEGGGRDVTLGYGVAGAVNAAKISVRGTRTQAANRSCGDKRGEIPPGDRGCGSFACCARTANWCIFGLHGNCL